MTARLLAAVDAALRWAAVTCLLGLLATVGIGVAMRQLGRPLSWTEEVAQLLLVWCGSIGLVLALRRGSHIRIDVIAALLPGIARRLLEIAIALLVAGFGLAIAWFSLNVIRRNLDIEMVSVPLSAALLYLPLPLVGLALAAAGVAQARGVIAGPGPHRASSDPARPE